MPQYKKPIETEWRAYAEQAIPFDASDEQRIECRRAFYTGATALVRAFGKLGPGVDPIKAYLAVFKGATDELQRFIEEGKPGRA